jgi:exodeoxyribonuclease-5
MVLASKGVTEAQTIHSFLYNVSLDKNGEINFTKKSHFDIVEEYSMICVDEASMVNKTQREELESFGLPVLYIGDSFQLPPISQFPEDLTFLSEPEYQLTEVKRNTGPIIDLSMKIRNFERLQFGKFGEGVFIINESKLTERMLLSSDQILVGRNTSRRAYNDEIRTLKGYDINNMPAIGEPLLVLNNNPSVGLFNGTRLYSVDDNNGKRIDINGFQFNYLSNEIGNSNRFNNIHIMEDVLGVPRVSIDALHDMYPNEEFTRLDRIKVYLEGSINFQSQKEEAAHLKINKCIKADFDYAKTVHKSQGSAYDKPIIIEEVITRDKTMHARWLYTAVTRAVRKLVLVKA